jgi:putative addiction module component (TIGR02574 family)
MTGPVGRLLEEALGLPDHDRAALAARLIESLDPDADDDAPAAWGDEVRRRLDELDRGEVRGIPWSEARLMIMDDADDPAPG